VTERYVSAAAAPKLRTQKTQNNILRATNRRNQELSPNFQS